MKKIINIDGKEYTMQSSAYTQFAYRDLTGRSLLKDLQTIIGNVDKVQEDYSILDDMTEMILDIAYIMIKEADEKQVASKEDFYKSVESIYDNENPWLQDVITLAINPISRQLQNNINK